MRLNNLFLSGMLSITLFGCSKNEVVINSLNLNEVETGTSTLPNASKTIANGLVAYYPFNGNANDATGNSYNGTVYGAVLTKDRFGKRNSAYQFNGLSNSNGTTVIVDNSIQVPNFNYNFGNVISISVWVNMASTVGGFLNRRVNNSIDFDCTQYNTTIYGHFGSVGYTNGTKTISLNQWHNYIYVYDGSNINLYLDGVLDVSITASGNISNNTSVLSIGKYVYQSAYYYFFNGKLDDIRIYNRALNTSEISYLATH